MTDAELCDTLGAVETVRRAAADGVTMVRLCDMSATSGQRIVLAVALKHILDSTGVSLVINDDVAIGGLKAMHRTAVEKSGADVDRICAAWWKDRGVMWELIQDFWCALFKTPHFVHKCSQKVLYKQLKK